MPVEIERKFLVTGESWKTHAQHSSMIRQAYITRANHVSVRVRIIDESSASLTVKLPKTGLSRFEFEQDISLREGQSLLEMSETGIIVKRRHRLLHDEVSWEVDEYLGLNQGLVIAEIELDNENQSFSEPEWLGREVTGIHRYQNSTLARNPYSAWPAGDEDHHIA